MLYWIAGHGATMLVLTGVLRREAFDTHVLAITEAPHRRRRRRESTGASAQARAAGTATRASVTDYVLPVHFY